LVDGPTTPAGYQLPGWSPLSVQDRTRLVPTGGRRLLLLACSHYPTAPRRLLPPLTGADARV